MAEELMKIPLSNLRRCAGNVRKTDVTRDLEELAASIAAHGLLQNLTVRPAGAKGANPADDYEVIAGGRRLAALKLLAKRKQVASDLPVPCRVIAHDDAVEVSLAENVVRTPLHPADQFDAFSKLHGHGLGIEEIAARFGTTPKIVQQRLKLAAVSPKLMAAYRAGDMTLDQLMAFTLTDDHATQERVWFDGGSMDRYPQTLRRLLTRSLVDGSDRRARLVGADAYEAAGGVIVRDLFRTDDDGYFTDSQLLDRLAAEKLGLEAEKVKAEGWAWVEAMTEVDYAYLSQFRRVPPTEVELSKKDAARLSRCCERYDELIAYLEDDAPEEINADVDRLTAEIETLSRKKEQWSDEDKVRAGAVITLDYHGKVCVTRGLARENGSEARNRRKTTQQEGTRADDEQARSNGRFSDPLLEDLTAHRTAALRAVLAGKPGTALRALAHLLILRTFFGFTGEGCVDIRTSIVDLRPSAEGIGESTAVATLATRHTALLGRLPEPDKLWAWLGEQPDDAVLEFLAYGVAITVNAVRRKGESHGEVRFEHADMIGQAVGLDMADWWEPSGDRYLNRMSKAGIIAAVSEAVSPEAGENIRSMKKDAMAAKAEKLLAGKRWLPEVLRPVEAPMAETA